MLKKTFLYASAVALLASCANDDALWQTESGPAKQQITIQPKDDLTFGYNSIITETDSLATVSIPLNTDVPVTVSLRDGYAPLQCVNVDGKYYLQVANPAQAQTGIDKVTLSVKGHPELTKSFLFTVRQSYAKSTRAAATVDPKTMRFASIFSFGQFLCTNSDQDIPSYPMFNIDRIYNPEAENSPNMVIISPLFSPYSENVRITGTSIQEVSKSKSSEFGLSRVPIANSIFGFDYSFSQKSVSKNYYEYLTDSDIKGCAAASLNPSIVGIKANDEKWKQYISDELDKALNCPGSDIYGMYAETDSGACKLIDAFGSHLITYCELGAKATLEFRKKQDMTQTSIDQAVKATITVTNGGGSTPKDWSDVIVAKYLASKLTSVTIGYGCSNAEYAEETEAQWHTKLVGGNANAINDMEKVTDWNATEDPAKWVPLTYRKKGDDNADVRAIYEFCQDTESVRYKTLKHVLEDVDENGINIYVKHKCDKLGIYLSNKETEWVLGGIYVDVDKDMDFKPSPFKGKLADGKTQCMFYPFTDIHFLPGECLNTQKNYYSSSYYSNGHFWYFAMVMRDDFPGLEDFKLVNVNSKDKYTNEKHYYSCMNKEATSFEDGWLTWDRNKYVLMAKAIDANTPKNVRPITGLSLEAWYYKDLTGENHVFGVSGGTGKEHNGMLAERYDHYWTNPPMNPGGPSPVKYVKDQDGNIKTIYDLYWCTQLFYPFLRTTTVPIRPYDAFFDNPTDMIKKN